MTNTRCDNQDIYRDVLCVTNIRYSLCCTISVVINIRYLFWCTVCDKLKVFILLWYLCVYPVVVFVTNSVVLCVTNTRYFSCAV